MRFKRLERYAFTDTARKRAALDRKQRLEREALPLFATQIAAEQPTADDVMQARAERFAKHELERRHQRARDWRRARADLSRVPPPGRDAVRAYWQRCSWPGDPLYLLMMLNMYAHDRLESVKRPRPAPAPTARLTG